MTREGPLVIEPEPRPRKRGGCRHILLLLLILACLATSALTVLVIQQEQIFGSSGIRYSDADPDLNPAQRLYLLSVLNRQRDQLRSPAGTSSDVQFVIPNGATADEVVDSLVQAGLLEDRRLFLSYLRFYGWDSLLQAGQFTLDGQMTIPMLAASITEGSARDATVSFLPGLRIEEMADVLTVLSPARIDPAEFLALARREQQFDISRYPFLNSLPDNATLEGFLYPDTYRVPHDADAAYLLDQMLQNFDRRVTPGMRQAFGAQGLTLTEAVTLASIVAREALIEEERPLIASVYLNRVAQSMPLQADPTVQYASGYHPPTNSWWKVPLDSSDLQFNHPYNTYVVPGLPPGPIANPGRSSLQAIAEPAQTDFLFFVVDCTSNIVGQHVFSRTFEEHLGHVRRCN
ncbi:MAG: endolytic transglycosylase MltG [Candidatus Promineifilaceae bacterium]|nr:endolytic transglycosylase MltG [Candidatus Promineifilaceae bacterium]